MSPFVIGAIVVAAFLILSCIKMVKERTALVVERLGKFNRILQPGLNFIVPILEKSSKVINLKIQQMNVHIETKTKDNVFVKLQVSVHVQVMKSRVKEAYYELDDPYAQISSYIFDVVRAEVPKLELDDVFVRKDDIAIAVRHELSDNMEQYGYQIIKTLITDIDPDGMVKESMNRINAAKRNKEALAEDAEGRKIAKIKDAEAEKESKRLQGEGVAEQRLAIIQGFADSVEDFSKTLSDVSPVEIMQFVLLTQHYDTIKDIGEKNSSILVPYSPGSLQTLQEQILEGSALSNELNKMKINQTNNPKDDGKGIPTFKEKEMDILDIDTDIDKSL
jgi:regulator of protease activity HflC (stomatin/prohibitin superfamily)